MAGFPNGEPTVEDIVAIGRVLLGREPTEQERAEIAAILAEP